MNTTYNVTATNEKIDRFNSANRWSRLDVTNTSNEYFTRDEKNHLVWITKWAVIGFIVASAARYLINQL